MFCLVSHSWRRKPCATLATIFPLSFLMHWNGRRNWFCVVSRRYSICLYFTLWSNWKCCLQIAKILSLRFQHLLNVAKNLFIHLGKFLNFMCHNLFLIDNLLMRNPFCVTTPSFWEYRWTVSFKEIIRTFSYNTSSHAPFLIFHWEQFTCIYSRHYWVFFSWGISR